MKPKQAAGVMVNGIHYQDGIRTKPNLKVVTEEHEPEQEGISWVVAVVFSVGWQAYESHRLPSMMTRRLPVEFDTLKAAERWVKFLNTT